MIAIPEDVREPLELFNRKRLEEFGGVNYRKARML